MGEIRSTLDIIMEKTKNLTMTDEEKEKVRQDETTGKIRGLVQKYLDGIMDLDRLRVETAEILKKDQRMSLRILLDELNRRLEPGGDNEPVLKAIEYTAGMDTGPVRDVLKKFEVRLEKERGSNEREIFRGLEKRGISGTAVVPNPNADKGWKDRLSKMHADFLKDLGAVYS